MQHAVTGPTAAAQHGIQLLNRRPKWRHKEEDMAKDKKSKSKPSVKVGDMKAKKDPKGGAVDVFLKLGDIKGEMSNKIAPLASKFQTTTTSLVDTNALNVKLHK